mgnify:CR=1 FL=1
MAWKDPLDLKPAADTPRLQPRFRFESPALSPPATKHGEKRASPLLFNRHEGPLWGALWRGSSGSLAQPEILCLQSPLFPYLGILTTLESVKAGIKRINKINVRLIGNVEIKEVVAPVYDKTAQVVAQKINRGTHRRAK